MGGGTCQWAAQMAKAMGYKVIGTCAEGKKDVGLACGVDELIVLPEVAARPTRTRARAEPEPETKPEPEPEPGPEPEPEP